MEQERKPIDKALKDNILSFIAARLKDLSPFEKEPSAGCEAKAPVQAPMACAPKPRQSEPEAAEIVAASLKPQKPKAGKLSLPTFANLLSSKTSDNKSSEENQKDELSFDFIESLEAEEKLGSLPFTASPQSHQQTLAEMMDAMGITFAQALLKTAEEKNLSDSELYKKAQVSRATFNKIINGKSVPGKTTAAALALALELSEDSAEELLGRAGIHLSDNNRFDIIIRFCLQNAIYDISRVNDILYEFDQMLIGSAQS